MELWQVFFLSLIQGISEFLPISSSAHLVLPAQLLSWPDQGLAFDVAVHLGTLLAVLSYFRSTLWRHGTFCIVAVQQRTLNTSSRYVLAILISVIPACIAGLLLDEYIESHLRSVSVIATTTVVFALLLGWADFYKRETKSLLAFTWRVGLILGCFQALALVPGTSRSGITITAALLLGYQKGIAARISFMMAIPVVFAASSLKLLHLIVAPEPAQWPLLLLGTGCAALSAYFCIHYFLKLLDRVGLWPFVLYRLLLGAVLFFL